MDGTENFSQCLFLFGLRQRYLSGEHPSNAKAVMVLTHNNSITLESVRT